jgi:FkbM family methyltransferase
MTGSATTSPHPRWKRAMLRALATVTPLRSRRVRSASLRATNRLRRARRRRLERRGDSRLSRPAQHGIDERLAALLGDGGFFVEAGANDGFQQSNTYYLERFHGWRGILIEPIPELYAEAVDERPASRVVNAALVSPEDAGGTIQMRFGGLMSIVAGSRGSRHTDLEYLEGGFALEAEKASYDVQVPARTLSEILDEVKPPKIDLLSLDVEGFEPQALAGLDFDRHAPDHMLVEVHEGEAGIPKLGDELGDRYELLEWLSPIDALLRRKGIAPNRSGGTARVASTTPVKISPDRTESTTEGS